MHRLTLIVALVLLTAATPAPAGSLAEEQDSQAQVQSIEASKLTVQQMHLQLALDQLRLKRAALEDDHRMFTLYKQSVEDVLIFALVIVMTSAGVYMSYIQFSKSIRFTRPGSQMSAESAPINANAARDTTIKINLTGVEITSSVTGLLVLAVSLAFFYLYIDKVFEIHEVGVPAGTHQAASQ